MKIQTLERYIKRTTIPYGDLLKRAEAGGLVVNISLDGAVEVRDTNNKRMLMYFEDLNVIAQNKESGLIKTVYNY